MSGSNANPPNAGQAQGGGSPLPNTSGGVNPLCQGAYYPQLAAGSPRDEALSIIYRLLAAAGDRRPESINISPEASSVLSQAIASPEPLPEYGPENFRGPRVSILGLDVAVEGCPRTVERLFTLSFPNTSFFQGGPLIKWISYVLGVLPTDIEFNDGACTANWYDGFYFSVKTDSRVARHETLPNGTTATFYEGGSTGLLEEFVTADGPPLTSFSMAHACYEVSGRPYWDKPQERVPRTRAHLYTATHSLRGGLDTALSGQSGRKSNSDDVKLTKAQKRANRKLAADLGSQGAGALARLMGMPEPVVQVARRVGAMGGSAAARLTGLGPVTVHNYKRQGLRANSIVSGKMSASATYGGGVERVRGREMVTVLKSNAATGTAPVIYEFPIQPGLQQFAQSLALTAMRFGEYCIEGLVFEFVSEVGESSTSGVIGAATVGYKADANKDAPTDVDSMSILDDVMDFRLSESAGYAVECDPKRRLRQCLAVRTGAVTSGSLMDYDFGSLVVALTPGAASADVELFKLYVSYDVVFYKQQMATVRPGSYRVVRTSVSSSAPLGTVGVGIGTGMLASVSYNTAGTILYFMGVKPGTVVRGKCIWYGTSATSWTAGTAAFNDATGVTTYNNGAASTYNVPLSTETCSKSTLVFCAKVTAASNKTATLTLSGYTLPGASQPFMDVELDSLGYNLVVGKSL